MTVTTYRPMAKAAWRPALRGKHPVQVGQIAADALGVRAVLAPILGLAVAGGAAYLGIRAGLANSGATQWIGWIVGISGAIAVVTTLMDLFYLGATPQSTFVQTTSPGTVQP